MNRRWMMSAWVACWILFLAAGETAAEEADIHAAREAARHWLALTDGGKYAESWSRASALFRGAVTVEQWGQAMRGVREPLGAVVSRSLESARPASSLPGAPDGQYVVIQYRTSFAKKASATETITPMREPDGAWRVSGYYIR